MIITIFGINATGKDAIAKRLQEKYYPDLMITTESRLLMYYLGIISSFDCNTRIDKSSYALLEQTPQEKIISITEGIFSEGLMDLQKSEKTLILLSHLVFCLNIDKKRPRYLTSREIPLCIKKCSHGFIQLVSSPYEILKRRKKDSTSGIRDRGIFSVGEIMRHQSFCDEKWERLKMEIHEENMIVIHNKDLGKSTSEAFNFIERLKCKS